MSPLDGILQDKSTRPRIRPARTVFDQLQWMVAVTLVLTGLIHAAGAYPSLPASIPSSIGADGQPRGSSPSWTVFLMPGIAAVATPGLLLLQRWPWISNTLVAITEENAEVQYRLVNRLLGWVAIEVALVFLLVTIDIVRTAQGQQATMILPIMLLSAGGTLPLLTWYFWRSFRHA